MSRSRFVFLVAVLSVGFAIPGWGQGGMVRGTVVDGQGEPIADVQVTVTSEHLATFRKKLVTNNEGEFGLRFQKTQTQYEFQFFFEKPGYQSFKQPLSPSAVHQIRQTFPMEIAQSQVVQSLGDLSSVVTGSTSAAVEAFNAGLTAQKAGDLVSARALYEDAVEADGTLVPAQISLGQVLLDQGEHSAAVEVADRALELLPKSAEALRVKYQALRALGRTEEAEVVGDELQQADDAVTTARRLYNEGGEAFQANEAAVALAKFKEAANLDPTLTDAHHAIATLELANGNFEASATAAEAALALGSEDIRTVRVLYEAYAALGRTDQLAEIAPRLAAVDPDFGGSKLLEQAADMWNQGQAEKAVALSRLAVAIDPGLAKAYYFIGLDHVSRGENAEARLSLQRFIDLAPDDPDAATAGEMLVYLE
jgi:tetratricopeptide (TPR) repeat protein